MIYVLVVLAALALGVLLGFALPAVVRLYKITQFAYGKGFENGRQTYGALVRRAEKELTCKHTIGGSVCRNCALRARVILEKCQQEVPPSGEG